MKKSVAMLAVITALVAGFLAGQTWTMNQLNPWHQEQLTAEQLTHLGMIQSFLDVQQSRSASAASQSMQQWLDLQLLSLSRRAEELNDEQLALFKRIVARIHRYRYANEIPPPENDELMQVFLSYGAPDILRLMEQTPDHE